MVLTDSGLLGFWLRFRSVTGFFKPAPSQKPRHKPKILAAHRDIFSVNALNQGILINIAVWAAPKNEGTVFWRLDVFLPQRK
jgi:hypothetical protein